MANKRVTQLSECTGLSDTDMFMIDCATNGTRRVSAEKLKEYVGTGEGEKNTLQQITFTGAVEATYDGSKPVEVEIPKTDIPRIEMASTDTTATIEPNTLYVFPEMASLNITLGGTIDTRIAQEYRFRFTSGATATTLTLPANVVGEITVEANKVYEVSILDGYLVSQSWEVS